MKLGPDHIALGESHIVNLDDLFGGRKLNGLAQGNINQIFSKLLKPGGLMLASDLLGYRSKFKAWIKSHKLGFDPPLTKAREDVNQRADKAFTDLLGALKTGNGVRSSQEKLRAAHEENMKHFLLSCEPDEEAERERARVIARLKKKTTLGSLTDIRALGWLEQPQYTDSHTERSGPLP